jgi:hypothetical protein
MTEVALGFIAYEEPVGRIVCVRKGTETVVPRGRVYSLRYRHGFTMLKKARTLGYGAAAWNGNCDE